MKKTIFISLSILAILALAFSLIGPIMSQVETPAYKTVHSYEDKIEVRTYAPQIVAKVTVEGARSEAIGKGFRLLADFIFGNNISNQDISMTAPVQQQASEEIAMTAPVQQTNEGGSWAVEFIMPSAYTMDTLPKPSDDRIEIIERGEQHTLTIRFSGRNSDENVATYKKILDQFILDNKVPVISPAIYAFYNPPWTLPFLRRNEISYVIPGDQFDLIKR